MGRRVRDAQESHCPRRGHVVHIEGVVESLLLHGDVRDSQPDRWMVSPWIVENGGSKSHGM